MKSFLSQTLDERRDTILNGNVLSALFFLSLPTLLMSLVGSFIPIIDAIFLNKTTSQAVASAVGLSGTVINILSALSGGLAVASKAVIAHLNGKGDYLKIQQVSSVLMRFSLIFSLFLMPGTFIGAYFLTLNANPEVAPYIWNYLAFYTPVVPLLFMAALYNSFKEAIGEPESTFIRICLLLILKIFFNLIYLFVLGWQERGAALGSLSSYICISIWMYYDLYLKKQKYPLLFSGKIYDKEILLPIFRLGIPSMLNFLLISIGFFLINVEILKYSTNVINSQTIAASINAFCFTLPASISSTVTTMVSMNISVGHSKQAKRIFYFGLIFSIIIAFSIIISMYFLDRNIIRLFRDEEDIINITKSALFYYNWSILPFGIFSVTQAVLTAFGRTHFPLYISFLRIWLLRYAFIILTEAYLSYNSIFIGNLISNIISMIFMLLYLYFIPWKSVIKDTFNFN